MDDEEEEDEEYEVEEPELRRSKRARTAVTERRLEEQREEQRASAEVLRQKRERARQATIHLQLRRRKAEDARKNTRLRLQLAHVSRAAVQPTLTNFKTADRRFAKHLHTLYYDKKFMFGIDRIYAYLKENDMDMVRAGLTKKFITEWLSTQQVRELHKSGPTILRNHKDILRRTFTSPCSLWQTDLIDMGKQAYKGFNWILTVQDAFSKYCWAVPLKDKEGETVANALEGVFEDSSGSFSNILPNDEIVLAIPSTLQSDNGSEFKSGEMKHLMEVFGVKQVFSLPHKPQTNGLIEGFNKNIKIFLSKYQTQMGLLSWPTLCADYAKNYNNSKHNVTKATPLSIMQSFVGRGKDELGEYQDAADNIKIAVGNVPNQTKQTSEPSKYQVGDKVRLKISRSKFEKSNGLNWTMKPFVIKKITAKRYGPGYIVNTFKLRKPDGKLYEPIVYDEQLIPYVKSKFTIHNDARDPTERIPAYIQSVNVAFKLFPDYYDPTKEFMQPVYWVRLQSELQIRNKGVYMSYNELKQVAPKMLKWFNTAHNVRILWETEKVEWDRVIGKKKTYIRIAAAN